MSLKKYTGARIKRLLKVKPADIEIYLRFYLNEISADELTDTQQEKLERFRKVWSYYTMGRTQSMIISALKKDYNIEERQAKYDIASSIAIHGKISQVDKDGRTAASIEYFDMLSQLALKEKQYLVSMSAREKADQLAELHIKDVEGQDPKKFMRPTKMVWNIQVNNYGGEEATLESTQTIELDE
jgi:hypothetical protein